MTTKCKKIYINLRPLYFLIIEKLHAGLHLCQVYCMYLVFRCLYFLRSFLFGVNGGYGNLPRVKIKYGCRLFQWLPGNLALQLGTTWAWLSFKRTKSALSRKVFWTSSYSRCFQKMNALDETPLHSKTSSMSSSCVVMALTAGPLSETCSVVLFSLLGVSASLLRPLDEDFVPGGLRSSILLGDSCGADKDADPNSCWMRLDFFSLASPLRSIPPFLSPEDWSTGLRRPRPARGLPNDGA